MSAPRTKRPFAGAASDPAQRQITSFFSTSTDSWTPSASLSPGSYGTRPQQPPTAPSLPATVQTNLLSVGMRVRKSVPEGYKTGTSYGGGGGGGGFALWDESGSTSAAAATMCGVVAPESRSRANAFSAPRELLPFCGIHKVGGLGTQAEGAVPPSSSSSSSAVSPTLADAAYMPNTTTTTTRLEDDFPPGLTSSQESMASTDSSNLAVATDAARPRKRSFKEEGEGGDGDGEGWTQTQTQTPGQLHIWRDAQYDGEVSPRSLAPVGWVTATAAAGRVMAVPRKGRLRNKIAAAAGSGGAGGGFKGVGQENVMIVDADGNDFDEADFLVDVERSWEVEMSDI